jgi:hypothetical protein
MNNLTCHRDTVPCHYTTFGSAIILCQISLERDVYHGDCASVLSAAIRKALHVVGSHILTLEPLSHGFQSSDVSKLDLKQTASNDR